MTRPYLFGILMLLACSCLEVSSKPSNNESTVPIEIIERPKEKSLSYDITNTQNEDATRDILERIKAINDALKKPNRRNQWNPWNPQQPTGNGYILNKDILETFKQAIASGKINPYPINIKQEEGNVLTNEDVDEFRYSRQLSPYFAGSQAQMAVMPTPYVMNMPVVVMPSMNNMYNYVNPMDYATKIQTKEGPSPSPSPFPTFPTLPSLPPFQWPFAPLFPILIRDPLLSIMNGGGWNNFIEYGQSADICRKQKSGDQNNLDEGVQPDELETTGNYLPSPTVETKIRQKRAVKKRTINQASKQQDIDPSKLNKFFSLKHTTAKPVKQEPEKNTKNTNADDGDVRFHLLDLFGHKNRQPSGPGFVINRLKVRRGGVAIAGPGGVATAGRGGTAIVGPGGLAYTQPGGLAVAGPQARVVALSSDADLTSVAHRLHEQSTIDGSIAQLLQAIPEGKVVAIGPVIYHHPNKR